MTTQGNTANNNYIRNAKRVGGARINNDWQYLEEESLPNNPTADQTFNQSYKQQGLGARKITRENQEEANNVVDLQNYKARMVGNRYAELQQNQLAKNLGKQLKNQVLDKGLNKINQRKSLAVNRSIIYWASYVWLFVQLPFAVLATITLAIMGGLSTLGDSFSESNFLFKFIASVAGKTAEFLKDLVGFSPTDIMTALFFIFYIIALASGLITLIGAYLQHAITMSKPLGGEGAGFKIGTFLLALVGYSVPVLNLFPWALVWLFAISKYPR